MDNTMIYVELLFNLALLVSLSIVSGFFDKRLPRKTLVGALVQGALFGGAAAIGMLKPLNLGPGLIFDGRSVMISLCALFFGPPAAITAAGITAALRFFIGGSGMFTGLLSIFSAAALGLLARRHLHRDKKPPTAVRLYLFGIAVHIAMLAVFLTLPGGTGLSVIKRIGLPIMLLYPLATVLAGKVLSDHSVAEGVLRTLKESEEKYKLLFENAGVGIGYFSPEGATISINAIAARHMGGKPRDFAGKSMYELFPKDAADMYCRRIQKAKDTEGIQEYEDLIDLPTEQRWFASIYTRVLDSSQKVIGVQIASMDISRSKQAEEEIRQILAEKDVLLREVHHRVKNNLNIITSLLNLQSSVIHTPEQAIEAFGNSRDRIIAMALVHEELYKTRDYARVDMKDYLEKLTLQIRRAYGSGEDILLDTRADGIVLNVTAAVPCGLILNELITNAFKHAFPKGGPGEIRVHLQEAGDGFIELSIADTGKGLPEENTANPRKSLGLTLVHLLTEQLDGTLSVSTEKGTAYSLRFPRGTE
jgi:PAS domain S-box-containing protein